MQNLQNQGFVNYFGKQRFGYDNNNLHAAAAWHQQDYKNCIDILCADSAHGSGMTRTLHRHFRNKMDPQDALKRSGKSLRQFLASALQSEIFNAVCNGRIKAGLDRRAQDGDLLMRHGPSAFHARDDELKVLNDELLSNDMGLGCSAPLPGHKVRAPGEDILKQEQAWSQDCAVPWSAFNKKEIFASTGQRRRIYSRFLDTPRFVIDGNNCSFHCSLAPGSYVTVVLEQLGISWDRKNTAAQTS